MAGLSDLGFRAYFLMAYKVLSATQAADVYENVFSEGQLFTPDVQAEAEPLRRVAVATWGAQSEVKELSGWL